MRLDSNRSMLSVVVVAAPLICSSLLYGQNSVDFQLTAEWQGGYNADIVLEVDQDGPGLNGWEFSWLGSPEVQDAWNCTVSQDGDRTVLDNVWYNETIDPGESVVLGFTGIGSWPPSPEDVRINGVLVDVSIDGDGGGDDGGNDGDGGHGDDGHGDDSGGHDGCCFGDIDDNRIVDGRDLAYVLVKWNSSDELADLDQSNVVDGGDLALVLSQWGSCDHDHGGSHDHGDYMDITVWDEFHDSNGNSHDHQMVGGRTIITTEAMEAYNNLRGFLGLSALVFEDVGQWAFDEELTNNSQAWGNDLKGVGLWYAMQGAKVGWITDKAYDPQILADIQRTARTVCNPIEMEAAVMDMVRQFGIEGYADYLEENEMVDTFINTLRMEPHHGGWMHGRCHGFLSIEGVAIAHDINHLTVLNWAQTLPFYNDTFDWPQWPALDVSDSGVIEYFQSMVVLGDPRGQNM
ncbi:MAG: cellulose binding domain-containing protein [Phycisphaerales bacterium]|nr:cellulose binding domain-containing protein [Phycisphaerales bacterium]